MAFVYGGNGKKELGRKEDERWFESLMWADGIDRCLSTSSNPYSPFCGQACTSCCLDIFVFICLV